MRKNNKKIALILSLALLIAAGLYFTKQKKSAPSSVAVSVTTATLGDLTPQITTMGSAVASNQVEIKSQVTGQLDKILVKSGQTVELGDTLFVIDQAPFQASLNQARAIQNKDQATEHFTVQQLERYSHLAQQGYVSKDFFAQVLANAKTAKAAVIADNASVVSAELQLAHCTIKAPIQGRLGDIIPYKGDLISSNATTNLVSIKQFTPIDVQFSLPAKEMAIVKRALNNPDIQVLASSMDDPNLHVKGTIHFIDNQIDPATGSIIMKARFANSDAAIWPGESLQIKVNGQRLTQVILIPSEAINENQNGGFYVYTVDAKQRAHLKSIDVGSSANDLTAVLHGLSVGDKVVTIGQFRLSDGALVNINHL